MWLVFRVKLASKMFAHLYCSEQSVYFQFCRLFKKDKPEQGCCASLCGCFLWCKAPQMITRVTVLRATGLEKQDTVGGT